MADLSDGDLDLMARTLIGEAGNQGEGGQAAVAHTILNRLHATGFGDDVPSVVLAKNQFEPWTTRRRELMGISTNSPAYQQAYAVAKGAAGGDIPDPTNGATHFFAPKAQAALGRPIPGWAMSQGTPIGDHVFFRQKGLPPPVIAMPKGPASDPFSDYPTEAPAQAAPTGTPAVVASPSIATPRAAGDPFAEYPTDGHLPQVAVKPVARAASSYGAPKLIWDKDTLAGRDPTTGQIVVPGITPQTSQTLAGAAGVVSGVPIVGPALLGGAERAAAGLSALSGGGSYEQELARGQAYREASSAAYPKTATAGNIGGAIAGTLPAMVAAPELFGAKAGMSLLPSSLISGGTGAVIGGADAAARNGLDRDAILHGAEWGGVGGLLGPAAGRVIGSGLGALTNLASRTAPWARNVASIFSDIGMDPKTAGSALTRIGPNAALADLNPALQLELAGVASRGGTPTSIAKSAMNTRAASADNRVSQGVDQILGPKPDLNAVKEGIVNDAQTAASPYYNAARASAQPVNAQPILASIDAQLQSAVGGKAKVLEKAKSYLVDANGAPKTSVNDLHEVRQALDDDIGSLMKKGSIDGTSAGKGALRAGNDIRGQVDSLIKSDPNMAAGDAAFASRMAVKNAVDEGTELFTKNTRIEDFRRSLASATPEQVEAMRKGARVAIGDALEGSRGELSNAQSMFGRGSANRAKLDALFPNASDVFDMLHGAAAMKETERQLLHATTTADKLAVAKKYDLPTSSPLGAVPAIVGQAAGGGAGALAASAAQKGIGMLHDFWRSRALDRLASGTAGALSAMGQGAHDALTQVSRASQTAQLHSALLQGGGGGVNALTRSLFLPGQPAESALSPYLRRGSSP